MSDVTDDERLLVLRELWDRTIRPEDKMSERIGLSHEKVVKCLEALEAKSLVQRRRDKGENKWRITPEGEAFIEGYQRPWYERPYGLLIIGLTITIVGGIISGVIVVLLGGA